VLYMNESFAEHTYTLSVASLLKFVEPRVTNYSDSSMLL